MLNQNPWELVWGQPYIDADKLSAALQHELAFNRQPDFRTRLLVRDCAKALESYWGSGSFAAWLQQSPVKAELQAILREDLGGEGFHNIGSRLVANIGKVQLEQIMELLGRICRHQQEVYIAGSIPTLIAGLTVRPTDDIDFVDEVPAEIRAQHDTQKKIAEKFGFTLGHVQSHYLPANWRSRLNCLGDFGPLRVYLVDPYDIFVSKLSSKQEKHLDDLRVLALKLDRNKTKERLQADGRAFLDSPFDRPTIEENWKFIYREPLLFD